MDKMFSTSIDVAEMRLFTALTACFYSPIVLILAAAMFIF